MPTDDASNRYAGFPHGLAELGGDLLDDDDRHALAVWRDSLALLDPRYAGKSVLALGALAMANPRVRARLLDDPADVLAEAPALAADLPHGVTLKFHENSGATLHVVLPPRAGETAERPVPIRALLRSRTEIVGATIRDDFNVFSDDFDLSNSGLLDAIGVGDPDLRDSFP